MFTLCSWLSICLTHIRFRAGWLAQGRSVSELPYAAPFYPYNDYLSLGIGGVVILGLVYVATTNPTSFIDNSQIYRKINIFTYLLNRLKSFLFFSWSSYLHCLLPLI